MMTLGWLWPILQQHQFWSHRLLYSKRQNSGYLVHQSWKAPGELIGWIICGPLSIFVGVVFINTWALVNIVAHAPLVIIPCFSAGVVNTSVHPSRYLHLNHCVEFTQTCCMTSLHGKIVWEQHFIFTLLHVTFRWGRKVTKPWEFCNAMPSSTAWSSFFCCILKTKH